MTNCSKVKTTTFSTPGTGPISRYFWRREHQKSWPKKCPRSPITGRALFPPFLAKSRNRTMGNSNFLADYGFFNPCAHLMADASLSSSPSRFLSKSKPLEISYFYRTERWNASTEMAYQFISNKFTHCCTFVHKLPICWKGRLAKLTSWEHTPNFTKLS